MKNIINKVILTLILNLVVTKVLSINKHNKIQDFKQNIYLKECKKFALK